MEVFKQIVGYEGLYEISDRGTVKSLEKKLFPNSPNHVQVYPERILRTEKTSKGYQRVMLAKNGEYKKFYVHRLVASHFIPNPENKPQVNHINHRKFDNRAKNLEWVTNKENAQHYKNKKKK